MRMRSENAELYCSSESSEPEVGMLKYASRIGFQRRSQRNLKKNSFKQIIPKELSESASEDEDEPQNKNRIQRTIKFKGILTCKKGHKLSKCMGREDISDSEYDDCDAECT